MIMTIAEKKTEIAGALTGVAGVTAYATKPAVLMPGDAFVRWRGWTRGPGQAFESTYAVAIVLPQQDEEAADAWAYENADLLAGALLPVLFVDAIEPSLLPAEGSPRGLFTLTITGRSE
jgi:hypothetical protein